MTVLDKLVELGPKCPCGWELRRSNNMIYCVGCGIETEQHTSLDEAWIAWYVVSGGPIPGEIKPPEDMVALHKFHTFHIARIQYGEWVNDVGEALYAPRFWYFIDRNPKKIRAWLESEVVEWNG